MTHKQKFPDLNFDAKKLISQRMFRVLPQTFQTISETLDSSVTKNTVLSTLSFTLVYATYRMHQTASRAMRVEILGRDRAINFSRKKQ